MQGNREKYFSNILIGIDTSGSVSMQELEEFQNELHHMHKTGHTIEIILCDTIIQDQFIYNPKKPMSVKGRGGTNFAPVVDYYQKNLKKYSCLIYLTDGESWDVKEARGQILWCHSSACSQINESLPGKKIKLN
jgi:predicted metal-dependent peptidase